MSKSPYLIDLSGNGRDASCSGFEWKPNTGIATDGSLMMAGGLKAQFYVNVPQMPSFTVIIKRNYTSIYNQYRCLLSLKDSSGKGFIMEGCKGTDMSKIFFMSDTKEAEMSADLLNKDTSISYMTPKSWNGHDIEHDEAWNVGEGVFRCGRPSGADNYQIFGYNGKVYDVFLFNTELTEEQIQWVIKHLIKK